MYGHQNLCARDIHSKQNDKKYFTLLVAMKTIDHKFVFTLGRNIIFLPCDKFKSFIQSVDYI